MHLKYKSGSQEVQGVSFSKGQYKFKGSEIDRSLSYARLVQTIAKQQLKPEKSLAHQLREAIRSNRQEKSVSQQSEQKTYLKPAPETHHLQHALSTGTELFGKLLANMPEEEDTPDLKRRKRKKQDQEQSRGISR